MAEENKDKKTASSNDDWNDQNVGYRVVTKEMQQKKDNKYHK